jgi:hypothetical protein
MNHDMLVHEVVVAMTESNNLIRQSNQGKATSHFRMTTDPENIEGKFKHGVAKRDADFL